MIENLVESDELLLDTPLDPSEKQYLDIESQIEQIKDLELLDELFTAVLDTNTVEEFTAVLENMGEQK